MTIDAEVIERLLGKPWKTGSRGPDEFDCWGLVQHVEREFAGRELIDASDPPIKTRALHLYLKNHPARKQWRQVDAPVHLGVVEMAHVSHPHHIGVYLDVDGGIVLHSQFSTGVTADTLFALRRSGWGHMRFYDWVG